MTYLNIYYFSYFLCYRPNLYFFKWNTLYILCHLFCVVLCFPKICNTYIILCRLCVLSIRIAFIRERNWRVRCKKGIAPFFLRKSLLYRKIETKRRSIDWCKNEVAPLIRLDVIWDKLYTLHRYGSRKMQFSSYLVLQG